ncbi:hypothetical protein EDB87DRAFT_1729433 [Lactarius vividus]|nr:hypothetical protein EDB87DRAFT_1729433 [Lactarius vividus]
MSLVDRGVYADRLRVMLQRAYLPEFDTRRETWGSCGITVATKTSAGDNGKEMRNASGEEEEEDAGRIQEVKLRDISETGVLLIHFQGVFKLSLESETYHKVNNEAKVKRGRESINQWLKHTTPGRIKPQAQSDNPSETRNHTVHEADPITIQAQAHLDPSGHLPAWVTFVMQDVSGVDAFASSGCNPFGAVLLGGAARVCTGRAGFGAKRNTSAVCFVMATREVGDTVHGCPHQLELVAREVTLLKFKLSSAIAVITEQPPR